MPSCHLLDFRARLGHQLTGFALIELLVVVAIIAALASLLMPAIALVRNQARIIQCRSNLRICTLAVEAYTQDNEGLMPYTETGGGEWWPQRTSAYLDDTYRMTLYSGNNIYHCPFAATQVPNQWHYQDRFSFNFGMNRNVYAAWQPGYTPTGWNTFPPVARSAINSQTVMLADGHVGSFNGALYFYDTVDSWSATPWSLAGSDALPNSSPSDPSRPRILLHGGVVNRTHMDGHASGVTLVFDTTEQGKEWSR